MDTQDTRQRGTAAFDGTMIGDVFVETATPPDGTARRAHPVVYIHGGGQGSWAYHNFLQFFAARGWTGHAVNWFGHHGSGVPEGMDPLDRGIADLTEELEQVIATLDARPVVVGHSMGGLAVLKYAESHPVAAVVMLASVVPAETDVPDVPFDFVPGQPYPVPSFEIAHAAFFDGMTQEQARYYYERLSPISSRQLLDGSAHRVSVDPAGVSAPVLAVGGELDPLCPADLMEKMSGVYGFDFIRQPGRGHNLPMEAHWSETASLVAAWLDEHVS